MIDVAVYLSSLQKQTASRKIDVLNAFAQGAAACGAKVTIQTKYEVIPARLAVILGWASPLQHGPNIRLRSAVIKEQKRNNNHVMAIDASTFKFHDPDSRYLRYSLNGVFYDTSEYANRLSNGDRWQLISRDLNLSIKPWRTHGEYVLLLMQRDGGWSMKGLNPLQWALGKYHELRRVTDLPIRIRPHPGKKIDLEILSQLPGVTISNSREQSIIQDLSSACCAMVFNSSSGVASVLEGVPLIVDDSSSVCWAVSDHGIGSFGNFSQFDRQQWIWDLAAAHWSDDESRQGLVFRKFESYF